MVSGSLIVVSGVIIHEGRVLLTQRRVDKSYPFTWECPGGKVEGTETHHDALFRELCEEVGIVCDRISKESIWNGTFARNDRNIHISMYLVDTGYLKLNPVAREGQGIGWFTAEEMQRLTLAPGNALAVDAIAGCL